MKAETESHPCQCEKGKILFWSQYGFQESKRAVCCSFLKITCSPVNKLYCIFIFDFTGAFVNDVASQESTELILTHLMKSGDSSPKLFRGKLSQDYIVTYK